MYKGDSFARSYEYDGAGSYEMWMASMLVLLRGCMRKRIPYVRMSQVLTHLFLWDGRNIPEASPNLGGEGFRRLEFGYVVFFNDDGCVLRYVSTYFSGSFPD